MPVPRLRVNPHDGYISLIEFNESCSFLIFFEVMPDDGLQEIIRILLNSFSLYKSEYYSNDSYNQQYMYNSTSTEANKSDCPCN